jgi:hypothetical protein
MPPPGISANEVRQIARDEGTAAAKRELGNAVAAADKSQAAADCANKSATAAANSAAKAEQNTANAVAAFEELERASRRSSNCLTAKSRTLSARTDSLPTC